MPVLLRRPLRPELLLWGVALIAGLLIATLPLVPAGFLLAGAVVLLLTFLHPLAGLGVTLLLAPLGAWEKVALPGLLPLDSGQLFFFLTVVAWLAWRVAGRRALHLPAVPLWPPLVLFLLVAGLSLLDAVSLDYGLREWVKWAEVGLVVWLVVDVAIRPGFARHAAGVGRRWFPAGHGVVRAVVLLVLLSGLSQALIGIWQFGLREDGPEHFLILGRFYRAYGTFEQPNPFGGFMALCTLLGLGMLLGYLPDVQRFVKSFMQERFTKSLYRRAGRDAAPWDGGGPSDGAPLTIHPFTHSPIHYSLQHKEEAGRMPALRHPVTPSPPHPLTLSLLLLTTLATALALLFSWSRGAWLGFGAGAALMVLFWPRRRWQGVALLVGGLALFLLLLQAGLLPAALTERLVSFREDLQFSDVRGVDINDANYAVLERLAHWQSAVEMARAEPWLGVGFGNYEPAYADFALINWPFALGHAHNYYLNILAETGVLGTAAYLLLWAAIFWQTLRVLRRLDGPPRGIALGLLGVWGALSVHHLLDNLYVNNLFLHIAALFAVLQVHYGAKDATRQSI